MCFFFECACSAFGLDFYTEVADLDYLVDQLDSEDPWTEKHRYDHIMEHDVDEVADVFARHTFRTWC
jgi:hypothetical protein